VDEPVEPLQLVFTQRAASQDGRLHLQPVHLQGAARARGEGGREAGWQRWYLVEFMRVHVSCCYTHGHATANPDASHAV
jgi:hypothetical protein